MCDATLIEFHHSLQSVALCFSVKTTLEYNELINVVGLEVFNDSEENILDISIICRTREFLLVFSSSAWTMRQWIAARKVKGKCRLRFDNRPPTVPYAPARPFSPFFSLVPFRVYSGISTGPAALMLRNWL